MSNRKAKVLSDVGYVSDETGNEIKMSEHTSNQMEIGDDYTVIKQQGFIRNLTITPRPGKDNMYKFQIRFIDENDVLQEPNDWYSGFKDFHGVDGDYIIFNYKKNGIWNNVKEILDIKSTHDEPQDKDIEELQKVQLDIDDPEITSDLEGESATVSNVLPTDIDKSYKALLLNGTIHLCTRRGTLTHDEIVAQYIRFLKLIE